MMQVKWVQTVIMQCSPPVCEPPRRAESLRVPAVQECFSVLSHVVNTLIQKKYEQREVYNVHAVY